MRSAPLNAVGASEPGVVLTAEMEVYEGLQTVLEHDVGVTEKCVEDEALYESLGGER